MARKCGCIEVEGTVVNVLPSTQFYVKLDNGFNVKAYISGKLRTHNIKIIIYAFIHIFYNLLVHLIK